VRSASGVRGGAPSENEFGVTVTVTELHSSTNCSQRNNCSQRSILSVAERLWLEEYQIFRETFIMVYTSARTVTGYQLAKIAPVHY